MSYDLLMLTGLPFVGSLRFSSPKVVVSRRSYPLVNKVYLVTSLVYFISYPLDYCKNWVVVVKSGFLDVILYFKLV